MNKALAQNALKDLNRRYLATTRWHTWCDGMHAVHVAAGMFEREDYNTEPWRQDMIAQEREYMAANKRPRRPSKDHKHQMYSDAYRAAACAELEVSPGSIHDLAGITNVINLVTAALARA